MFFFHLSQTVKSSSSAKYFWKLFLKSYCFWYCCFVFISEKASQTSEKCSFQGGTSQKFKWKSFFMIILFVTNFPKNWSQRYYYYIHHGIDTKNVAPMEDVWIENVLRLVPESAKVIQLIFTLSKNSLGFNPLGKCVFKVNNQTSKSFQSQQ